MYSQVIIKLKLSIILQECKKLDRNINDLQHYKVELDSKLTYLKERLIKIQKDINDLVENIEDTSVTKIKVCILTKLSYISYLHKQYLKYQDKSNQKLFYLVF